MSENMLFDYAATGDDGRSAILSPDGVYRYSLRRWWAVGPTDLWIMCNPSTADHRKDDPTITRCIGFSKSFGSGSFVVANCYGYRATKPTAMWAAQQAGTDIIGPDTNGWLLAHILATTGRIILAWGAHPKPERAWHVATMVEAAGRKALCLGTTKDGQPRHPLMLASATSLRPWSVSS